MLAGCPQKDGRLLDIDSTHQGTHRIALWYMVSEPKEVMQMKSRKGYIKAHKFFLCTKSLYAKPHSLVTKKKDQV